MAEKRTAERELALKLGALILLCFRGHADSVVRVIDEAGLGFVQMKALVSLQTPGDEDPTVTGLAEMLGISPASASRAVDGLVRKGLASRIEDAEDRRIRRLALTESGRELADRIIAARLAGLEEFAGSLSKAERARLEGALDVLLRRPDLALIHETYERKAGKA